MEKFYGGLQKKLKIDLGEDYYFNPTEPTFTSNTGEEVPKSALEMLGAEFFFGTIQNKLLEHLFPKNKVYFLPISGHPIPFAFFLKNIFGYAHDNQNSFAKIYTDFPIDFKPILHNIINSYPTSVAVTNETNVLNGFNIQENSLNETKLQLFFIESMDSRRLALKLMLDNKLVSPENIIPLGGNFAKIHLNSFSFNQDFLTDYLTNSSYLALVQNSLKNASCMFSVKKDSHLFSKFNFTEILENIKDGSEEKYLILASTESMLILNEYLKLNKSNLESNQLEKKSIFYLDFNKNKNKNKLELAAVDSASAADLSLAPGFVASDYFSILGNQEKNSWLKFLQESYSQAFFRVEKRYLEWTKFDITKFQRVDFFRYAYRLAKISNRLIPSNIDLTLAARSIVDNNFAFEILQEIRNFPQVNPNILNLPVITIPIESIFSKTIKVRCEKFTTLQSQQSLKKRFKVEKQKNSSNKIQENNTIDESKYTDNSWVSSDNPYFCSFPEEDIFMEDFAFQYRKQASDMLKDLEINKRELTTSLGDGLDIRETLRNWHQKKIIIQEELHTGKANIGSIIFNFVDPNEAVEKYSWTSYWLAEAHDKAHLMFFATPFEQQVIGPGIAKSEFGGFAVIPIPGVLENPWENFYIQQIAKNPLDALVLAGAFGTNFNSILLISDHPVSHKVSTLLKRSKISLITLKLSELPPDKIRRLRTFHILAEAGVRCYAAKYLRKDY